MVKRPRGLARRRGLVALGSAPSPAAQRFRSGARSRCRRRARSAACGSCPGGTSSSTASSVTTTSERLRSPPAIELNSSDHVSRSSERISVIRSSTEGGLGSTCRGRSRCCSSIRRLSVRSSQWTDRSSSGTSSSAGSVLDGRPQISAYDHVVPRRNCRLCRPDSVVAVRRAAG